MFNIHFPFTTVGQDLVSGYNITSLTVVPSDWEQLYIGVLPELVLYFPEDGSKAGSRNVMVL
jgi:hypothetical protein